MGISITITDADSLSDLERAVLRLVLGDEGDTAAPAAAAAKAPAKKAAAPAKKAAAKPAPEPEPEEDEEDEAEAEAEDDDLLGGDDEYTMKDAIAKATALVSSGKANDVKKVLKDIGVDKVSHLKGDQINEFMAAWE